MKQIPFSPSARATRLEPSVSRHSGTHEAAADLAYKRLAIVNVILFGSPGAGDRQWVLIDAGVIGTARLISRAAAQRFGTESRPACIVLTHGHFDHVGALEKLAAHWEVPIFAHDLEMSYLNGQSSYPAPDPSVGGGFMSTLSAMYPRGPINVSKWLQKLPEGEVPGMPGWTWLHTPGHTQGHVSLWRESDRTLIAGDAFITTDQESAYSVAVQKPELHGPPTYYTPDWEAAERSVRTLAALEPELVIAGHGPALRGAEMREALHLLADDFKRIAVPEKGLYVKAGTGVL